MLSKETILKLPLIPDIVIPTIEAEKFINSDKDSGEVSFADSKTHIVAFQNSVMYDFLENMEEY